jgi:hypothetical protein
MLRKLKKKQKGFNKKNLKVEFKKKKKRGAMNSEGARGNPNSFSYIS